MSRNLRMKVAWKKLAVAGVLGFCAGKSAGELRRHPDVVIPVLQVSAASGVVGGLVGWCVSLYRRVPPHTLSLSLAANFSIVSATFIGIRRVVYSVAESAAGSANLQSPTTTSNGWTATSVSYVSSLTSGGFTGALTSLVSRYGLRSILMTSLGGMGMGLCAQAGYDGLQEWCRRKAIQIYCEDVQGKTSLFDNWTLENFEARFLGFWHRRAESIAVETEMLSLESAVAEERRKLVQLDQQLADRLSQDDILEQSRDSPAAVESGDSHDVNLVV